jgi:hypothetical protein
VLGKFHKLQNYSNTFLITQNLGANATELVKAAPEVVNVTEQPICPNVTVQANLLKSEHAQQRFLYLSLALLANRVPVRSVLQTILYRATLVLNIQL